MVFLPVNWSRSIVLGAAIETFCHGSIKNFCLIPFEAFFPFSFLVEGKTSSDCWAFISLNELTVSWDQLLGPLTFMVPAFHSDFWNRVPLFTFGGRPKKHPKGAG